MVPLLSRVCTCPQRANVALSKPRSAWPNAGCTLVQHGLIVTATAQSPAGAGRASARPETKPVHAMLIAQISDLHVRPQGQRYRDVVDSNAQLSAVIEHLHGLDTRPDLVILSGDLVDEGRPEEYAQAAQRLRRLAIPFLIVAGNHDDRSHLRSAFAQHSYLPSAGALHYCFDEHPVRIVVLDTCQPGAHHGEVDASGLAWLAQTLSANRDKPTLVVMHHPPFVSGIPYLDGYRLAASAPLADVLRRFDNIEAVLCGHVHRTMVKRWAGTVVISCPSTTTEIALQLKADARPQSFLGPSAYLLHRWHADQGLVTHLCHVEPGAGPYPFF
jgi:Icc protein